jgi:phospholipid/cholesterol/gamma-HCH transport system substrate-binding protein
VYGTTPEPLLGANPPKPERRPPLNADVPCETQQNPDLRTVPAAPPEQKTVDTTTPAFQARYAKARDQAIDWLEGQLKAEGLQDEISVSGTPATKATIDKLRAGR